jgi:hypothetical protein
MDEIAQVTIFDTAESHVKFEITGDYINRVQANRTVRGLCRSLPDLYSDIVFVKSAIVSRVLVKIFRELESNAVPVGPVMLLEYRKYTSDGKYTSSTAISVDVISISEGACGSRGEKSTAVQ